MPLGTDVGLCPDGIVLDGDPAPLSKNGAEPLPNFIVYCSQMPGLIKMALDMEVGLGPSTLC